MLREYIHATWKSKEVDDGCIVFGNPSSVDTFSRHCISLLRCCLFGDMYRSMPRAYIHAAWKSNEMDGGGIVFEQFVRGHLSRHMRSFNSLCFLLVPAMLIIALFFQGDGKGLSFDSDASAQISSGASARSLGRLRVQC